MLINCYYYAPHNHSMLLKHLDHDLAHIAELGAHAVSLCVQESHMAQWHRPRLERVIQRAKLHGLQVHAVPNRWCGLLAGWCDGFNEWTVAHPQTLLPDYPRHHGFSDPAHPAVGEHYRQTLDEMFDLFDFDGLIWDEPRPAIKPVMQFLDQMTAYAKSLKPGLVTSIFAEAGNLNLAPVFAELQHIDYLGADGHLRSNDHLMHRMKNTIFTTHAAFEPVLKAAGKQTMYLIEAQRHRDEDLGNYLLNLECAFTLPMDQLMFYYSAHEMLMAENEERFNEATWRMVRQVADRAAVSVSRIST